MQKGFLPTYLPYFFQTVTAGMFIRLLWLQETNNIFFLAKTPAKILKNDWNPGRWVFIWETKSDILTYLGQIHTHPVLRDSEQSVATP